MTRLLCLLVAVWASAVPAFAHHGFGHQTIASSPRSASAMGTRCCTVIGTSIRLSSTLSCRLCMPKLTLISPLEQTATESSRLIDMNDAAAQGDVDRCRSLVDPELQEDAFHVIRDCIDAYS